MQKGSVGRGAVTGGKQHLIKIAYKKNCIPEVTTVNAEKRTWFLQFPMLSALDNVNHGLCVLGTSLVTK